MSQALDGMHYCVTHQGNHSHYAEHNCDLCKCRAVLRDLLTNHLFEDPPGEWWVGGYQIRTVDPELAARIDEVLK